MRKTILLLIGVVFYFVSANAQLSLESEVFAEIIDALSAVEVDQLNFGRFSSENMGGTITVTPDGLRTSNGSVVLAGGISGQGRFLLNGAPEANIIIDLPEGPITMVHSNSSNTIEVSDWRADPHGKGNVSLNSDGSLVVAIGATLKVNSTDKNPVGLYSGTYQITFSYN